MRWRLIVAVVAVIPALGLGTATLADTPETVVTVSPSTTVGWAGLGSQTYVVQYIGALDGANVVVEWGDGDLTQATAVNFQVTVTHTYWKVGAYPVQAEVFTSNCPADCVGLASAVIIEPKN